MLLQLGPEAPLSAVFGLRGGGTAQMFIAPSLEEEEEEGADELAQCAPVRQGLMRDGGND